MCESCRNLFETISSKLKMLKERIFQKPLFFKQPPSTLKTYQKSLMLRIFIAHSFKWYFSLFLMFLFLPLEQRLFFSLCEFSFKNKRIFMTFLPKFDFLPLEWEWERKKIFKWSRVKSGYKIPWHLINFYLHLFGWKFRRKKTFQWFFTFSIFFSFTRSR